MFRNIFLSITVLTTLLGCAAAEKPGAQTGDRPSANAIESEVGNGGHGIRIGGKMYLYDLWEAGLETKALAEPKTYEGSSKHFVSFAQSRLVRAFRDMPELADPLARRLVGIWDIDPVFALSLMEVIEAYTWAFTDVPLKPLQLPQPVHKLDKGEVFLLANRVGRFIYLHRKGWQEMDRWNQLSLLLHEAIYSLLPPQAVRISEKDTVLRQNGRRAREIVALLSGARSERELQGRFADFVDEGELPSTDPGTYPHHVTSTFFLRIDPNYRHELTPGRLALVGAARYLMLSREHDLVVPFSLPVFTTPEDAVKERAALERLCTAMAKDDKQRYQRAIEFPAPFELRFASYQENGELKQYVQHQRKKDPIVQITSIGDSEIFFRIASTEGGNPFEPVKPTTAQVVTACQRFLGGGVARRFFFFAGLFPLDTRLRYGN